MDFVLKYLFDNGVTFINANQITLDGDNIIVWNISGIPEPNIITLRSTYNTLEHDKMMKLVREKRNELLRNSDFYLIQDFPISVDDLNAIKTYRTTLRDLPGAIDPSTTDFNSVVFPAFPL